MNSLGNRVVQLRKIKGYSQEVLAEKAGLNLRTIQRIEKGETDARGDSILRICNVLEVGPEDLMDWKMPEDRGYLAALNLSALTFLIFPLLGILVPLILWIYKKDKVLHANEVGRKLLNFEITWSMLFFLASFFFMGNVFYEIKITGQIDPGIIYTKLGAAGIVYIFFYIVHLVLVITNAILSYRGQRIVFYPGIPFLRNKQTFIKSNLNEKLINSGSNLSTWFIGLFKKKHNQE